MIHRLSLVVFLAVVSLSFLASAEEAHQHSPKGTPDNPTPQIRITSPLAGSTLKGPNVTIAIETKDFAFAYKKATTPGTMTKLPERYAQVEQEPNSGHVHVYLAPYPVEGIRPAQFFMVQTFTMPNATQFSLKDVKPGKYRLIVELVTHDHTPRIKHHQTDWPPLDSVDIVVE